jgi:hypothetical protein
MAAAISISSNRGIYSVGKDELNEFADGRRANVTAIAYGKSDGMLNAEWLADVARGSQGERWRSGFDAGRWQIDPREIKPFAAATGRHRKRQNR